MSAITCPFCNSLVSVAVGGRVPCPRCGEEFTVPADAITTQPTSDRPVKPPPYVKPIGANRFVGAIVLGVMLVMAGGGLWLSLATVDTRREHDKYLPRRTRRPALPPLIGKPSPTPVAPGRLAALAYLPPGCTFVAGVHVADLLDSPVGERLKSEKVKLGPVELSLESVEQWLGIPAGNIDHLAVGSVLEEGGVASLTPPTVLVVRTREAVGVNRLRETLGAASPRERPTPEGGTRPVSACRVKDLPLSLWLPNRTTVVVGLFTDLAMVPAKPADDNAHIAPATRQLVEERLAAGTVAWGAVSATNPKDSPLLALLPQLKALPRARLDLVRAAVFGVPRETPWRVQVALRAADEKAAEKLEAEAKPSDRLKLAREKEWLTIQVRVGE